MQEIDLKERWTRVTEKFAVYRARADVHPDLAWRVALVLFGIGMLLVATGGYLTYQWAATEAVVPPPSKGDRTQVSAKDIDELLALYEAKQAAFKELKSTVPPPPLVVRVSKQALPTASSTTPPTFSE